jgi:hypothetical protein
MLGVARLARLSETAGLALDAGTLIYSEQWTEKSIAAALNPPDTPGSIGFSWR